MADFKLTNEHTYDMGSDSGPRTIIYPRYGGWGSFITVTCSNFEFSTSGKPKDLPEMLCHHGNIANPKSVRIPNKGSIAAFTFAKLAVLLPFSRGQ